MPENAILSKMLDRLYASMAKGPSLNCRPHASRQRIDFTMLSRLKDADPKEAFVHLVGGSHQASVAARVPMPPEYKIRFGEERVPALDDVGDLELAPEQTKAAEELEPAKRDWLQQRSIITKLRNLVDDARIYEQDTGVHALHIGYPILSLPASVISGGTGRVLAPIAFIPVSLSVRTGQKPGIDLSCRGEGVDLVMPNSALLAWIERQTGKAPIELEHDEAGERPWEEIAALIRHTCKALNIPLVEAVEPEQVLATGTVNLADFVLPERLNLESVPKAEGLNERPTIYRSAVLGLFQMANQSLLRDTQSMIEAGEIPGPVNSFIRAGLRLDVPVEAVAESEAPLDVQTLKSPRQFREERLIALADPCQSRTVALARKTSGLVVHGPPGTGKSQTITNIIGDHLARGERVLLVCEKRTALDVVANRLEHLGLGGLCAVVHDPQRDQRDLYMQIRQQLDDLAEAKTNPRAEKELEKLDTELQRLHDELTDLSRALMDRPSQEGDTFHDLMGKWLAATLEKHGITIAEDVECVPLHAFESAQQDVEIILRRGLAVNYPSNPWVEAAGIGLDAFMGRNVEQMRRALASNIEDARAADATLHQNIPPFNPVQSLQQQARMREQLALTLRAVVDRVDAAVSKSVSGWSTEMIARMRQIVQQAMAPAELVQRGSLDSELVLIARQAWPGPAVIAQQVAVLNEYLAVAGRWFAFLRFGTKSRAAAVLRQYGLSLSPANAQRVSTFLLGLRARVTLSDAVRQLRGEPIGVNSRIEADDELLKSYSQHALALELVGMSLESADLDAIVRTAMSDYALAASLLDGLDRSGARAAALQQLEDSWRGLNLLNSQWLAAAAEHVRRGRKAFEQCARLNEQCDSLEQVIRIKHDLARIPSALGGSVEAQLKHATAPAEGLAGLRKSVLAGEISRRIASDSRLRQIDSDKLCSAFDRYRELESKKRITIRDIIIHRWRSKQKDRLVAGTGSRLNGEGAKLRQRLFVRGKRAMRLRQVIAIGQESEGGDPLFDLCPVWMASPETVAQIFPLGQMFDVVVFDEASQCKLEEALPVLARAKRVVIAGDPKQLPPTRFFEAAIAESDDDVVESDQDLFEARQGEIEDLLAAALNIEIEESYLDVHYRSRNSDLIEFSNAQFYGGRLQAIPGHPANRSRFAPITMNRVEGVYDQRCNPAEARRVCEIVRDLLKRADPPSIGIACFNLTQRDLILEMLDDLCLEDTAFASKLAEARERRGESSFEGLFVKNLENVQGDERDHMIISTTYGPNREGKFYRRFGPLGMPGGGRRLNVLVTRARHEVHLVTSIPREAYLAADRIPPGQTPNGGHLLFEYLRYAEELAQAYEVEHQTTDAAPTQSGVTVRHIEPFSVFAEGLGRQLAERHGVSSDVHWGNVGFRIDLALHHPQRLDDVTIGVLCDFAQYDRAQDAVEWDIFRTTVHQSQGWRLHRLWTPQYFRDAQRSVNQILRDVQGFLASDAPKSTRLA